MKKILSLAIAGYLTICNCVAGSVTTFGIKSADIPSNLGMVEIDLNEDFNECSVEYTVPGRDDHELMVSTVATQTYGSCDDLEGIVRGQFLYYKEDGKNNGFVINLDKTTAAEYSIEDLRIYYIARMDADADPSNRGLNESPVRIETFCDAILDDAGVNALPGRNVRIGNVYLGLYKLDLDGYATNVTVSGKIESLFHSGTCVYGSPDHVGKFIYGDKHPASGIYHITGDKISRLL